MTLSPPRRFRGKLCPSTVPPPHASPSSCRRRARAVRAVLLACLVAAPAAWSAAQDAKPAPASKPVFRTDVQLVVVEATAVDKAGNVARGLGHLDFKAEIGG